MKIIGGEFKGRTLKTPKNSATRPTTSLVRGALFNICQSILEGARCLDLFAGSGALGIEALSRGANFALFIEKDRKALDALRQNVRDFGIEKKSLIIPGDVFTRLEHLQEQFDLITADPPYGEKTYEKLLTIITEKKLLSLKGQLFIETASSSKLPEETDSLHKASSRQYGKTVLHQFMHPCLTEKRIPFF